MHLGLLIDRAQELAGRKDTKWDSRCQRWVNEAVREWSLTLPWPTLRRVEDFTFNSREGTGRILFLPSYVAKVLRVADQTNSRRLLPYANPDIDAPEKHLSNASGEAFGWRELGVAAVHRQPSAASAIQVQAQASDVYTCYVAGLALDTNASGTPDEYYYTHEDVSIQDSSVNTTTTLFVRIDTLGKTLTPTTGDTVFSTSADGRLARLALDVPRTEYRQIELIGAPTSGTVFQLEYLAQPPQLGATNDMLPPAIPEDYVIWYVASMIRRAEGDDQQAELFLARARELLERLAKQEKNAGDQDWRSYPDTLYWNHDDMYAWPDPWGG